jgi:hypothetical protein
VSSPIAGFVTASFMPHTCRKCSPQCLKLPRPLIVIRPYQSTWYCVLLAGLRVKECLFSLQQWLVRYLFASSTRARSRLDNLHAHPNISVSPFTPPQSMHKLPIAACHKCQHMRHAPEHYQPNIKSSYFILNVRPG